MMTRVKTAAAVLLCASCPFLFASGSQEGPEAGAPEKRIVTTVTNSTYAGEAWYQEMNADFTAETGIEVDVEVTAGTGEDSLKKQNIELLAGSDVDVIQSLGDKEVNQRFDAGFLAPMNGLLDAAGVVPEEIWGKYLTKKSDGEYYYLPIKQDINCVFYNKAVFDAAGVPYPEAPWTWEDYIETAKALTDHEKGIWGSYFLDINSWWYVLAAQKGAEAYKADGTSNFADPAFAESLKFYYDLGNVYQVQPGIREMKARNMLWNYFASTDTIGMHYTGNWFLRLLTSETDYPRDWDFGIVATPSAGPEGNNNLGSLAYVSVNANAAHPDEAIVYASWLAGNQWRYENGIPARVNLTSEEEVEIFQAIADNSRGSVTVEDLTKALIDNGMGLLPTDITGSIGAEYNSIINTEGELYCTDMQSLEETVAHITDRANRAIADL